VEQKLEVLLVKNNQVEVILLLTLKKLEMLELLAEVSLLVEAIYI
jgi:hypothetical protein